MKLYTLDNQFIEETSDFPLNFTGIAEFPNGTTSWLHDGLYHRLDGPAIEYNSNLFRGEKNKYYINGGYINCSNTQQLKLLVDTMKLKGLLN